MTARNLLGLDMTNHANDIKIIEDEKNKSEVKKYVSEKN